MKSKKSKIIGILLGLGISALAIAFIVSRVDAGLLASQFDTLNWQYLLLIIPTMMLSLYFRSLRWRYLIRDGQSLSLLKVYEAVIIGFFASFTLPLRAGEIIRPFVLSKWQPVTFPAAFISIVVERVFDVLTLLFLVGLVVTQLPQVPTLVTVGSSVLAMIAVVLLIVMGVGYFFSEQVKGLSKWVMERTVGKLLPALADSLQHLVDELIDGLQSLRSIGDLFWVVFWSAAVWISIAFMYQCGLWIFDEYPSFWVGMVINVMIALAVAAPSAPGFIGTFQVGCVIALSAMFSYSEEFAVAYAILMHVIQVATAVVLGIFVLQFEGLRLAELRSKTEPPTGI